MATMKPVNVAVSKVSKATEEVASTAAESATEKKTAGAGSKDKATTKRSPLTKLATHEDPYHLHKTLGILSLVSFAYRYLWVLPTSGTLGFEGSAFDWVNICLHMALSSSSIIFHVISSRKLKFPMLMWEEYRLHAIVFTLRCFSVYCMGAAVRSNQWLANFVDTTMPGRFVCFALVMAHHVLADYITSCYGTPGVTSVRVAVSKKTGEVKFGAVKKFYSFYQFIAISAHMLPHARMMDLGYNSLIAIQSSAFLMTLCRKNIITFREHGIIYTLCLVLSFVYIMMTQGTFKFVALTAGAFALRTQLRMDKYVIWATFTALASPGVTSKIYDVTVETATTVAPGVVTAVGTAMGAVDQWTTLAACSCVAVLAGGSLVLSQSKEGSDMGKLVQLLRGRIAPEMGMYSGGS
jgi:hypothetical protein